MKISEQMAAAMGLTPAEADRLMAEVARLEAAQDVEDQRDEFLDRLDMLQEEAWDTTDEPM